MKPYQFNADQAGSEESDGVLSAGVASSFGPYFMIQRSLESDGEGADDLYCEYEDQGKGAYGALRRIELSRESLKADLGDGTSVLATLSIDQETWTRLRGDLLRVLEGFDTLHNIR